ncbi:hypothetical protein Tco_0146435 [Tanacetum coccineum]
MNWKVVETNELTKPDTSHSVPKLKASKVVKNEKVITLRMSQINPFKHSRVDEFEPNKHVIASVRTKPITVSQPHVITKKHVNSNISGLSSTGVESTTRSRRPQPRSNTKNDKVPSASKSNCLKNNEEKVEEHHRNLPFSNNQKHMSSECYQDLFMVHRLGLLQAYDRESEAANQLRFEVYGNCTL